MFGTEAHIPFLPVPDFRRKFYGESTTDDLIRKFLHAQNVPFQNNEDSSDEGHLQFDSKGAPHKFLLQ
jgi:hypothetical protein